MDVYYYFLCHVCKKLGKDFKHCSLCKTVAYCSREHQKLDWKHHKAMCKVIKTSTVDINHKVFKSHSDLIDFKVFLSLSWQKKLNRVLLPAESQMWMFLRHCNVCYKINEPLLVCEFCLNVSYCCMAHKEKDNLHKQYCKQLEICMLYDSYTFCNEIVLNLCIKHVNLSISKFPKDLGSLMSIVGNLNIKESTDNLIKYIFQSDSIAPCASIIYCLETLKLINERNFIKTVLNVHVVGASLLELNLQWKYFFELLLHWIINIDQINFNLIGPELEADSELDQNLHEKVVLNKYQDFYHNVVDLMEKPDIIVCYNSGLHEFENSDQDTWKDSLDCLLKNCNTPLLLTAYTEDEILKDLNRFKNKDGVNIVIEPHRNPFSNLRPLRDWCTKNVPVFYVNGYIAALMKTPQ